MYFQLYPNAIPVWGKKQCIIVDLYSGEYYRIPDSVYLFLHKNGIESLTVRKINNSLDFFFENEILVVLNRFVQAGLGFFSSKVDYIKALNIEYKTPYIINNVIIEIDNVKNYSLDLLLSNLLRINCQQIEIRINNSKAFDEVVYILEKFNNSNIRSIQIIYLSDQSIDNKSLEVVEKNRKISDLIIFSSEQFIKNGLNTLGKIQFINEEFNENLDEVSFIINPVYFYEAHSFNASLNQKIAIDKNGEIKNYLTHKSSFGNINYNRIEDVINDKNFLNRWSISNDRIERCKECELRYFCLSFSDVVIEKGKITKLNYCNKEYNYL